MSLSKLMLWCLLASLAPKTVVVGSVMVLASLLEELKVEDKNEPAQASTRSNTSLISPQMFIHTSNITDVAVSLINNVELANVANLVTLAA